MKALLLAVMLFAPIALQPQTQERKQSDGKPCELVDGGSRVLTSAMKTVLASKYRSWRVKSQCAGEPETDIDPRWASVASGDYDSDGKVDQAVLLESAGRTIVLVFMSSVSGGPVVAGDGSEHLSTITRGSRGHDFDTEKDFTYETDALYTGDYHCCGASLVWRNGKFFRFTSSD
jgi:hypothetical protein